MIHCLPLPGAPHYEGQPIEELVDYAVNEAKAYAQGGLDGIIVENHGDIPFAKPEDLGPETAAAMAVIADAVRRAVGLPIGINVLANGAIQALAVAKAAGASFVRVNQWANAYVANEGFIEGRRRWPRAIAPVCAHRTSRSSRTCTLNMARTRSRRTARSLNSRVTSNFLMRMPRS